jgi:hypothetical protein
LISYSAIGIIEREGEREIEIGGETERGRRT